MPFAKGLDVIQQAQSGTGKTATFCAGILQNLDYNLVECQALVLAPTRELAQQIEKVMRALGDYQQVVHLMASQVLAKLLLGTGKSGDCPLACYRSSRFIVSEGGALQALLASTLGMLL